MAEQDTDRQAGQGGGSSLVVAQDPELLAEFLAEVDEHIASIENHLLALEQNPQNTEALQTVFRNYHSIKGLAGFLEFSEIQRLAHEVESLLDRARNRTLDVDSAVIDVILASADFLKRSMALIRNGGAPLPNSALEGVLGRVGALLSAPAEVKPKDVALATAPPTASEDEPEPAEAAPVITGRPDSVIRVHTAKLDYLVDMVGEMVIAQSMLRHDPLLTQGGNAQLARNFSQLNRITSEIQKTAMSMRMIPIGHLFKRVARLLRDLARKTGKRVELETIGEETELDRTITEELADPLMHMVRNSVDHGVESAERRAAAGKPPVARIRLKACHQGGHIMIELSDDGAGIDRQRVKQKARERGLLAEGVEPTDNEIYHFIFQPGFSTAAKVTDVSGRGVGMDVVRKHIEKLRGRVQVESKEGVGATFTIKLPLTLAIIEGLVVGVGGERYVVPIFAVREVLRPTSEMVSTVQETGEMARVRDSMLPIVRLHSRFRVGGSNVNVSDGILIVSENAGKRFCLLVDRLLGKQEVVIKNVGEMLKNIPGIAGSAILGDGHVAMILDMDGLSNDAE